AAWPLFQEIEREGGAWSALEECVIQRNVAAVSAERKLRVARRLDALTGTSDFPDLTEVPVRVLGAMPVAAPSPPLMFPQLPVIRLAAPFEWLRDASEGMLVRTGARPKIFLATLGKLADFTARATFAANFYAAGGIEAATSD